MEARIEVQSERPERDEDQNGLRLVARRPSFTPLVHQMSLAPASPNAGPPLTNHEIYELAQQQQKPQQIAPAKLNYRPGSLYLASSRATKLQRQTSVIVGTPGFRERYGK